MNGFLGHLSHQCARSWGLSLGGGQDPTRILFSCSWPCTVALAPYKMPEGWLIPRVQWGN